MRVFIFLFLIAAPIVWAQPADLLSPAVKQASYSAMKSYLSLEQGLGPWRLRFRDLEFEVRGADKFAVFGFLRETLWLESPVPFLWHHVMCVGRARQLELPLVKFACDMEPASL